jgi:hypothetical protein
LYINVINILIADCDYDSSLGAPTMKDIGILASPDLVALDQACIVPIPGLRKLERPDENISAIVMSRTDRIEIIFLRRLLNILWESWMEKQP